MSGLTEIMWTEQAGMPLLLLLQLLPLLGAVVVFAFKERSTAVLLGKVFALGELLLGIVVVSHINPTLPALQLAERFAPLAYHVAVDGLSLLFLLLVALLTFLMTLYGMSRGMISPGRLFAVLLLAETGLVGMLVTVNVAWFAAFSALELWSVVYLLRRWASSRAEIHALARFVQYQAFGWVLFAAGCLVLGWGHAEATGGYWSFDLFDLMGAVPAGKFETAAFYLLFYGLPVLLHPTAPQGLEAAHMTQFALVASTGFMADTTLALSRMIFDGFFDRYPKLKIIGGHGGATLPFIIGRLDRCFDTIPACRQKIQRRPSSYARQIYVDSVVYQQSSLALDLEVFGDDNVLYGSDYPHNIGDMVGCLSRVDSLAEHARLKVRGRNAQRIFKL